MFVFKGQLYIEKMHFRNDQVKKFWSEVAGFAGCVIIRRYVRIDVVIIRYCVRIDVVNKNTNILFFRNEKFSLVDSLVNIFH